MDPNAWQAYHQAAAAYTTRLSGGVGGQDDHHPPYHNPLSLLASASQHYQHNILPPSLLAAQHSKPGTSLTNTLLTPPVTPVSSAWDSAVAQRRSVIEAKASQPAFPGQPPPLQDARRVEASSPAFPGQPPPRQSSQPRSQIFPGSNHYSQQQHSPGYGNNYSPGAPSPQAYNHVHSPQDYHSSHRRERDERARLEQEMRERQKEKERQERQRIAEERREQERIRQEQEFRREQERIRQEKEREDKVRREREKIEQEERRRREKEKIELERRRREEEERRRREEEKRRELERLEQQRKEQEERDLGLARLSAMGTLNDLGEETQSYQQYDQEHGSNFNINMFNQYQQNMLKQENHEQKPLVNQFNNWINRASELLDLSSSDSRDTSQTEDQSSNFIPQILMNPWDPQQAPMMTLAPIANAMQQYQQQWLTQYQQAAGMLNQEEGSFPLGKFRVLCISPDEDMGFLINLPPPCNLLFQQEALVKKCVDSPFIMVFQKFVKDPALSNLRKHLCEAPDRPPPYVEPEERLKQEVKKEYVPPYTPRASIDPESKAKLSSSGYSRSLEITPVRRSAASRQQRTPSHSQVKSRSSNSPPPTASRSKQSKKVLSEDEEDEIRKLDHLRSQL